MHLVGEISRTTTTPDGSTAIKETTLEPDGSSFTTLTTTDRTYTAAGRITTEISRITPNADGSTTTTNTVKFPVVKLDGTTETRAKTTTSTTTTNPDSSITITETVRTNLDAIDLSDTPHALATTPDEVARVASAVSGGSELPDTSPSVAVVVVANGLSTGPNAFDLQFLNAGKPASLQGDGVVLQPLTGEDADRIKAMVDKLPTTRVTASATGYCLEKNLRPPADGEIYTLAPADEQQQFESARRILATGSRLQDQGALSPDSDPEAYFHSIRQWAMWTDEQGYDEVGFAKALIENTKENLEAAGQQWTDEMEGIVQKLVPNRWANIQTILERAAVEAEQERVAVAAGQ